MAEIDTSAQSSRTTCLETFVIWWGLFSLSCAFGIALLIAINPLNIWGLVPGFFAITGGPAAYVYLKQRGYRQWLLIALPIVCTLLGIYGMLVSGWTLFVLTRL